MYDWLIVGAGFAGSVLAERIASQRNETVLIIDRRDHIGGNASDMYNEAGVLIHRYGPHIFHTNSEVIFQYLSNFTQWRFYEHKVLADIGGVQVPIPINLDTINTLYGLQLDSEELEAWFKMRAEPVEDVKTSEDVIVSKVGRELYEMFYRGYTRKQWGLDPSELDKSVTARVPTRTNRDDRYFTDAYQFMPREGYTRLFENLLGHPNIEVRLNTGYKDVSNKSNYLRLIYTGQIDEYFDFCFGRLPYRSLKFRHVTLPQEKFQAVGTVNYPMSHDYTRISEYKHMTGQKGPRTSITYEFPTDQGDPYYPIPRPENHDLYKRYDALAKREDGTWFVGRLANYQYYNMDQVVGQALATFRQIMFSVPLTGNRDILANERLLGGACLDRPASTGNHRSLHRLKT
jgi:UDP-galactopyranose mutase